MASQKQALLIVLTGTVQGVGLRYKIHWKAEDLGLAGWVRNESDGSVTTHVEGMSYRTQAFQEWLRQGIEGAHIARMHARRAEATGFSDFQILAD